MKFHRNPKISSKFFFYQNIDFCIRAATAENNIETFTQQIGETEGSIEGAVETQKQEVKEKIGNNYIGYLFLPEISSNSRQNSSKISKPASENPIPKFEIWT